MQNQVSDVWRDTIINLLCFAALIETDNTYRVT